MRAFSFTEARFSEQLNNFPVLSFGFNYKILRELPMWGALAASLAVLSFQRQLSAFLLLSATALAFSQGILNFNALGFMAVVALAGIARHRWENQQKGGFNSEVLLVLAAVVLFLHLVPGFNNPKILDKVIAGPHSAPFSMYYNFDKALVPFILLLALPTLFRTSTTASRPYWNWLLLGISVPALLLIAVALGGLRIELHQPSWIWQFALANLFFVSLAEEALFRGYLQQTFKRMVRPSSSSTHHCGYFRFSSLCWRLADGGFCWASGRHLWHSLDVERSTLGRYPLPFRA